MKLLDKIFGKKSLDYDYHTANEYTFSNVFGVSDGAPIFVTPKMAYNISERNSDLGKAIGDISDAVASLKKGVKTKGSDIDYSSPIMEILNNPKGGLNRFQFWQSITESYELTQEIYIVARGQINKPPLELVFIKPYEVTLHSGTDSGDPWSICTTSKRDRRVYTKNIIDGKCKYIDKTGLNELIVIRGKISTIDEWRGRSPLVQLYNDVLIGTDGKRHNRSILKNGMKTSGILSPPKTIEANEKWDSESVKHLESYIRSFNQGSGNAGNVLIIGTPVEVTGLTQNNKEMDFVKLLQNSQDAIYNLYKIPLALISRDAMTYDNLTTANRMFYTEAVFPVFEQIAEGMLDALRTRYNMSEQEELTFSQTEIRSLQPVLVENMVKLKETESVTTNEVRELGGYEPDINGNEILVTGNKVPLSTITLSDSFEDIQGIEDDSSSTESIGDQTESDDREEI